jgi:thymidylate synthase (FAD)
LRLIEASYEIIEIPHGDYVVQKLERCARTCYKSEDNITQDSATKFLRTLLSHNPPHMSVIEHGGIITVKFNSNRGFTHEMVRHRLGSFSQESTRYCNYSKGKFDSSLSVVSAAYRERGTEAFDVWFDAMLYAERAYMCLLELGEKPEEARDVLPIALKSEIVVSGNLREWGHIFFQRTSPKAHPQMRELMIPLLTEVRLAIPVIYDDLSVYR